jgi:hypothetical protein
LGLINESQTALCFSRFKCSTLLGLNSQIKAANLYLAVWRNLRALVARQFLAIEKRQISALWREPVLPLLVAREDGVNAAHFRVAFER